MALLQCPSSLLQFKLRQSRTLQQPTGACVADWGDQELLEGMPRSCVLVEEGKTWKPSFYLLSSPCCNWADPWGGGLEQGSNTCLRPGGGSEPEEKMLETGEKLPQPTRPAARLIEQLGQHVQQLITTHHGHMVFGVAFSPFYIFLRVFPLKILIKLKANSY